MCIIYNKQNFNQFQSIQNLLIISFTSSKNKSKIIPRSSPSINFRFLDLHVSHKTSFKKSFNISFFFLLFFFLYPIISNASTISINIEQLLRIHGQARAIKMTFILSSPRQKRRKKSILLNKINYNYEIYRAVSSF